MFRSRLSDPKGRILTTGAPSDFSKVNVKNFISSYFYSFFFNLYVPFIRKKM